MLVLMRKRGESIIIGDDIRVTMLEITGDKVRLGISAPDTITIHRHEVYERIQRDGSRREERVSANQKGGAS